MRQRTLLKRTFFTVVFAAAMVAVCVTWYVRAEPPSREAAFLSDITQLTSDFDRAGEAYFSPDMKWIIFQAMLHGQEHYHMYVARLKWQGESITGIEKPIRISPDNSRNTCGHFSPDGKTLIFASTAGKEDPSVPGPGFQRQGRDYRWSYPPGMEIFRVDDWPEILSKVEPGGSVDLAKQAITDNDCYDAECSFSPDGQWIIFTSMREGAPPPPMAQPQPDPAVLNKDLELYAMKPDGSSVIRLTSVAGYDGGPFFSPDGKRILYRSDRKQNDLLQIFMSELTFDSAGNITGAQNEKQLTDDANLNWCPYLHPHGRHIIYSTSAHGHTNYELYLMRDDGSSKTRITYAAGADVLPVFSPDGKWLIWASKRNGKTTQVYVARFTLPE